MSRIDKEVWILEKNPQYWNTGLPYLDRLEIYHLGPWSPELAAALLAGKIDYARVVDPVTMQKVRATPRMIGHGLLPERHYRHLDQQCEKTVPGPACAPGLTPGTQPARPH